MTKLKLYNGEEVVEKGRTKKVDVHELRESTKREGMSGISTRFIMKALDNALSDNMKGNCINPINVREALINMVKEADLPDDTRKQHFGISPGHAAIKNIWNSWKKRSRGPSFIHIRNKPRVYFKIISTTPKLISTRARSRTATLKKS
jgi:serine protein kinase